MNRQFLAVSFLLVSLGGPLFVVGAEQCQTPPNDPNSHACASSVSQLEDEQPAGLLGPCWNDERGYDESRCDDFETDSASTTKHQDEERAADTQAADSKAANSEPADSQPGDILATDAQPADIEAADSKAADAEEEQVESPWDNVWTEPESSHETETWTDETYGCHEGIDDETRNDSSRNDELGYDESRYDDFETDSASTTKDQDEERAADIEATDAQPAGMEPADIEAADSKAADAEEEQVESSRDNVWTEPESSHETEAWTDETYGCHEGIDDETRNDSSRNDELGCDESRYDDFETDSPSTTKDQDEERAADIEATDAQPAGMEPADIEAADGKAADAEEEQVESSRDNVWTEPESSDETETWTDETYGCQKGIDDETRGAGCGSDGCDSDGLYHEGCEYGDEGVGETYSSEADAGRDASLAVFLPLGRLVIQRVTPLVRAADPRIWISRLRDKAGLVLGESGVAQWLRAAVDASVQEHETVASGRDEWLD